MPPRVSSRQIACLIAVLYLARSAPAVAGPVSPLYFTLGTGAAPGFVGELQGSAVLNLWPVSYLWETALALPGSVRTMGFLGGNGSEYTFAGLPTGVTYTGPGFGNWYDGTTDGTYN